MKRLYAIGIDFGTSNSCISQACYLKNDDGTLNPVPLKRPEAVTIRYRDTAPTCVFTGSKDEEPSYGEVAEEKLLFYPEMTVSNFKMRLGMPGQEGLEAFQHTREFLRYLRACAAERVPLDAAPVNAEFVTCVGHPVQWTAAQRDLTRRAATEAGFPNVSIEDESSAAIYDHLCEESLILEPGRDARVLVIDMGGGTTDFAFVELSGDPKVAPLTTPVDPSRIVPPWEGSKQTYGGRDLDDLMLRHLANPWGFSRQSREWAFLLRETRRFKEQFSSAMSAGKASYRAQWMLDTAPRDVRLSREEFEGLSGVYIQHLPRLIDGALSLAVIRPDDVSAVILTGGHSRWYWVEDAVRSIFPHISAQGGTLLRHSQPDQSVARGLAYRWMIHALGGRPKPRRRATHGIWIASPEPTAQTFVAPPVNIGPVASVARGTPDDPMLVMDRGQILPFHTPAPAKLTVQKMDFNSGKATLRLKIYSGSSESSRQELMDRVATFERPFWEGMVKRLTSHLPWSTTYDTDDFDVEVLCSVDENELFNGKVTITRYVRGHPAQQRTYILKMDASLEAGAVLSEQPQGAA
jgi:hypothetical protein